MPFQVGKKAYSCSHVSRQRHGYILTGRLLETQAVYRNLGSEAKHKRIGKIGSYYQSSRLAGQRK